MPLILNDPNQLSFNPSSSTLPNNLSPDPLALKHSNPSWPSAPQSLGFLPLTEYGYMQAKPDSPPESVSPSLPGTASPGHPTQLMQFMLLSPPTHCYLPDTVGAQPGYLSPLRPYGFPFGGPNVPSVPLRTTPSRHVVLPTPVVMRPTSVPNGMPKRLPNPPVLSDRIRNKFLALTNQTQLGMKAENCTHLPRRKKRTPTSAQAS